MVGKYEIEVYNNKVHYFLTIKRNITILQGNSATGKTELIRLIQEHETNGTSSGITLICNVKCTVLTAVDWELRLSSMSGQIVFIDETAAFLRSRRFAELVKGSDNYFVIVSRDALSQLPYSVDEIYGLRNVSDTQKYKTYKRIYNEMYKLYHLDPQGTKEPEVVITEDSNAGYEYFNMLYPGRCNSAHGKSNVYDSIRSVQGKTVLAIVDGAAFGSEIGKVLRYLETSKVNCTLYAPESFEYLILSSGLVDVPKGILQETYLYADSKAFMSWEEYYSAYLSDITRNTVYQYSKLRLAEENPHGTDNRLKIAKYTRKPFIMARRLIANVTYVTCAIWKPMHMQPIYRTNPFITRSGNGRGRSNAYISGTFEDVGADIFHRGLCLPSDNKMTESQQDRIIEIIHRCFL